MIVQLHYKDSSGLIFGKLGKEIRVDNWLIGYRVKVRQEQMIVTMNHLTNIKETT